jgi:hypothetical protein
MQTMIASGIAYNGRNTPRLAEAGRRESQPYHTGRGFAYFLAF